MWLCDITLIGVGTPNPSKSVHEWPRCEILMMLFLGFHCENRNESEFRKHAHALATGRMQRRCRFQCMFKI